MKTIQMTLDEVLLKQIDKRTRTLKTTRSAFIRESLRHYLKLARIREMEQKHREGYDAFPVEKTEFDAWESEQVWG
jgi:metal-responsive CopG/Arc/MetJ family transcriptional regulator